MHINRDTLDPEGQGCSHRHKCGQPKHLNGRLPKVLPALLVVLSLVFIALLSVFSFKHAWREDAGLYKRQADANTDDSSDYDAFIDDHLYL